MHEARSINSGFPGIAFATLPTTGETIAIRHGEHTYHRVDTSMTAEELNALYGVTEAQAKMLLEGFLAGWETSPTEDYDYSGSSVA